MTTRDRIVAALVAKGAVEVRPSPSRKYACLTTITGRNPGEFYWVGKLGGLRVGRSVAHSMSLTNSRWWYELIGQQRPTDVHRGVYNGKNQ